MKKILFAVTACFMMLAVMTGCGTDKSNPTSVVEAAYNCLTKQDYQGYMDLTSAKEEEKAMIVSMIKEKVEKSNDKEKLTIKSFEILDTDIDEENGKARIKVKCLKGDASEDVSTVDLVRDDKGEWKIKFKMK